MSSVIVNTEQFFNDLTVRKNVSLVQKIGLQDTTINVSKVITVSNVEFSVNSLYIFNREGGILMNYGDIEDELKLSKIVLDLLVDKSKNEFVFHKILYSDSKMLILSIKNLSLLAVFSCKVKTELVKLYLLHMFTAFVNFAGEMFNHDNNDERTSTKVLRNNLPSKLFSSYFIGPLTSNFKRVIKFLMTEDEMYLNNVKFKNFFVVDVNTESILCDLNSILGKKKKKVQKNEKLWQELMHHSHNLKNQYVSQNNNKPDIPDAFYNFVKVECTSTFPRTTFLIKFIPILNGLTFIHVYSQNKLSRSNDSETSLGLYKIYREFEILYGNELKNSTNIEFRYTEPKKLKEIERFFIEYLALVPINTGLCFNSLIKLKYFDQSFIDLIDKVLNSNRNIQIENLIAKIDLKLLEMLNNERVKNGNNELINSNPNTQNMNESEDLETEVIREKLNLNYLIINRIQMLIEIVKNVVARQETPICRENTLMLSKIEETHNKDLLDNEPSFDLDKKLFEISNVDYFEEEGIDYESKMDNENANTILSFSIELTEKGDDISKITKTQNVLRGVTKSLNKLQKSISNIEIRRSSSNIAFVTKTKEQIPLKLIEETIKSNIADLVDLKENINIQEKVVDISFEESEEIKFVESIKNLKNEVIFDMEAVRAENEGRIIPKKKSKNFTTNNTFR